MIELSDLKTGYRGNIIVQIDHLQLRQKEITVIVGKNGCGKSTLLRSVAGQLPYRGSIICSMNTADDSKQVASVDSTDLASAPASLETGSKQNNRKQKEIRNLQSKERARLISYLPQHLTIPEMSVETLVSHGRFCRMGFSRTLGERDLDVIACALRTAEVDNLRDKSISSLSGGERQRAYLAMTIAQDATMMLLDEPDTYMDISHKMTLLGILRKLRDDGRGIVMTSHDMPFAFLAADRICVMAEGEIVPVDIAIVPTARVYHKGERFRIQIAGRYIREGWFEPLSWDEEAKGTHVIHTGGQYDSWIEIPVIPPRYQAGEYIHR